MGGNYHAKQEDEGQGAPFGAAPHFLGHAMTGGSQEQGQKYHHGIISMLPTHFYSFGPIGPETTTAEPHWDHGLAAGNQGEVQCWI